MSDGHEETPKFCKFDFRDWLTSQTVRAMTREQRGVYIDLLGVAWCSSSCSLPADEKKLSAVAGMSLDEWREKYAEAIMPALESHPSMEHRLIQKRLFLAWSEAKEAMDKAKMRGSTGGKAKADKGLCLVSRASIEQAEIKHRASTHKKEEIREKRKEPPVGPRSAAAIEAKKNDGASENGLTPNPDPAQTESVAADSFPEFWGSYPNKVAKTEAAKSYRKAIAQGSLHDEIMLGLQRWKASRQWTKDGGEFIPHPTTWLNQKRWADDPRPNSVNNGHARANDPPKGDDPEYF